MSLAGAQAAWRGYRLQTWYILFRILLSPEDKDYQFRPEGLEDLAIHDKNGTLLETVQVKAYGDNLQLSHFKPEDNNSFLRRALRISHESSNVIIKVVKFGGIGFELQGAWNSNQKEQERVKRKLNEARYSDADVDLLFTSLQMEAMDEAHIKAKIDNYLRDGLLGGDPESAFEILASWLYGLSENQHTITRKELQEKLAGVGRYLAERSTYHHEWHTTIVPLEDRIIPTDEQEELRTSFYQGVDTRYEHILADVDIERLEKLSSISEAFRKSRLVILRGASGQGKSAVAFRYLHNHVPNLWRFFVHAPENQQQALSIARALAGHANAVGVPIVVYIEVPPRDTAWTALLKELSHIRNLQVLLTIREEDWRRAYIRRTEFDQLEEIELSFDEGEARQLYAKLLSHTHPERYLSFDEAWQGYGFGGPLLEFVYFVTQQETLRFRLTEQVHRLQDLVREGKLASEELTLLRWGAVATAFQSRLDIQRLRKYLQLPEPLRTLELFEKEYLLRRSSNASYVEGLHAIRSAILVELLTDNTLHPWHEVAVACLPVVVEDDLETFLLHSFSRQYPDSSIVENRLQSLEIETWTGFAGTLRALLWLGIRKYVEANESLIGEVADRFGSGWNVFIDGDLVNNLKGGTKSIWDSLSGIPEQTRTYIRRAQNKQTPKSDIFHIAYIWLQSRTQPPSSPKNVTDWRGIAEVVFWAQFLNIPIIVSWLPSNELEMLLDDIPLDAVGDVVLAAFPTSNSSFTNWFAKCKSQLLDRFQEETHTIYLEDNAGTIRAHFIVDFQLAYGDVSPVIAQTSEIHLDDTRGAMEKARENLSLHDAAMQCVDLLHKLVPDREKYGCQGYGHLRISYLDMDFDDTRKTGIPKDTFHPEWSTRLNTIFHQLGNWNMRPVTWREYAEGIFQTRQKIVSDLRELINVLHSYFRKQNKGEILSSYLSIVKWEENRQFVSRIMLLPQCAVDEWGFVGEGMAKNWELNNQEPSIPVSISLWKYHEYLEVLRDYTHSLFNFYSQSPNVVAIHAANIHREYVDQDRNMGLSIFNLAQALHALPSLQTQFRSHFEQFIIPSTLETLEHDETLCLRDALILWYQFATHPYKVRQHSQTEISTRFKAMQKEVKIRIRQQLRKLREKGINAEITPISVHWEGKTALWVLLDVSDPLQLYNAFGEVRETLRLAINGLVKGDELVRHFLQDWYEEIVIIPIVRTKALSPEVWNFSSSTLVRDTPFDSANQYDQVLHPVHSLLWEKLGTPMWSEYIFHHTLHLRESVRLLHTGVYHLSEIVRAPFSEEDKPVGKQIETYIQAHIADVVNPALQQVFDAMTIVVNWINEHLETHPDHKSLIAELFSTIQVLRENILPTSDFQNTARIELSQTAEWDKRLQQGVGLAEAIRLGIILLLPS